MGNIWGGLLMLGWILTGIVLVAAGVVVWRWAVRRLRLQGPARGAPAGLVLPVARGRRSWTAAVIFSVTAVLLPWAVGLGVKIYLDAAGRPTLPINSFLDPLAIPVLILMTLGMWSFPFVALATAAAIPWRVGFPAGSPGRDSLLPLWCAFAAGAIAAVPVFGRVFWEFDSMMLLVPVGVVLVLPMALGYATGWWILRRRR